MLDQDEEFEAMATDRILQRDPDSLAFLKAAKTTASSRSPQRAGRSPNNIRAKPRHFGQAQ